MNSRKLVERRTEYYSDYAYIGSNATGINFKKKYVQYCYLQSYRVSTCIPGARAAYVTRTVTDPFGAIEPSKIKIKESKV